MPLKSSEKAWVDRHWPTTWDKPRGSDAPRQPYLSFVRYMRWYCADARSYLMRKVDPKAPFEPHHAARWPRRTA